VLVKARRRDISVEEVVPHQEPDGFIDALLTLLGGGLEAARDRNHSETQGVLRHGVRRDRLWAPS